MCRATPPLPWITLAFICRGVLLGLPVRQSQFVFEPNTNQEIRLLYPKTGFPSIDMIVKCLQQESNISVQWRGDRRHLPGKLVRCRTSRRAVLEETIQTGAGSTSLEPALCHLSEREISCSVLILLGKFLCIHLLLNCFYVARPLTLNTRACARTHQRGSAYMNIYNIYI